MFENFVGVNDFVPLIFERVKGALIVQTCAFTPTQLLGLQINTFFAAQKHLKGGADTMHEVFNNEL